MTVYFVINTGKASALHVARAAADILAAEGVEIITDEKGRGLAGSGFTAQVLPSSDAYDACDVILTIGGDGTMLHAARHSLRCHKPLLGINIGRLGFLTIVESDELDKLRKLAAGEYRIDERKVLRADIEGREEPPCVALNDVVLFKDSPEKTIALDIYCDDILVSRFRGDGIIFSTPTGSTAYSMSAGGPILDARLNGTVVTQICAHIVHTPPLVVAADRELRAVSMGTEEELISISCDGIQNRTLEIGEAVRITQSDWKVPLIQFDGVEQLESIDKKLKGR